IEGLKVRVRVSDEDIGDAERDGLRMKVRGDKSDDFSSIRRFGQEVLVAVKHIAEAHSVGVGNASGADDVSGEIDYAAAVGQDGLDADSISVLHMKGSQQVGACRRIRAVFDGQGNGFALMISSDALDGDVVKRSGGCKAAGVSHECGERCFTGEQFVNSGTFDCP